MPLGLALVAVERKELGHSQAEMDRLVLWFLNGFCKCPRKANSRIGS